MKNITYICDIRDCDNEAQNKDNAMQVIFTTEQTEGRSRDPHFSNVSVDLCEVCRNRALRGNYIFAAGAQGSNQYWFRNERD